VNGSNQPGNNGTANTGGGGGGGSGGGGDGGNGGSGIVVIRYTTADFGTNTQTGGTGPTVDGSESYIVWNASGTVTFVAAAGGANNFMLLGVGA
jgi:hypothetical protein